MFNLIYVGLLATEVALHMVASPVWVSNSIFSIL